MEFTCLEITLGGILKEKIKLLNIIIFCSISFGLNLYPVERAALNELISTNNLIQPISDYPITLETSFLLESIPWGSGVPTIEIEENCTTTYCRIIGINFSNFNISSIPENFDQLIMLDSLDLSYNIYLADLYCGFNQYLTALNIQNGNNINLACDGVMGYLCVENCPNLNCIQVDDDVWSNFNWIMSIDTTYQYFSVNCNLISIQEYNIGVNILRVVDITGREVNSKQNIPLFYIYDDGIVEKKIIVE